MFLVLVEAAQYIEPGPRERPHFLSGLPKLSDSQFVEGIGGVVDTWPEIRCSFRLYTERNTGPVEAHATNVWCG